MNLNVAESAEKNTMTEMLHSWTNATLMETFAKEMQV